MIPLKKQYEADVAVIGGGIAGLMAAIAAADKGAQVVLLDKANTKRSGAGATGNDHFSCYIPEVHGDNVDDIMLYGRGAGALPTGSAIVSDIVFAAGKTTHRRFPWELDEKVDKADFASDFSSRYYIRLIVSDEEGTLSKIAGVFGRNGVSLASVVQKEAASREVAVIFVTHESCESVIRKALGEIEQLSGVEKVAALIRVEE